MNESSPPVAGDTGQGAPPPSIRAAGPQKPLPRAHPLPGRGCPRPYLNEQLNSRLAYPLPPGVWAVRWQAELDEKFPARYVLEGGDRILVQTEYRWELFSSAGKPIASEFLGPGNVVLDARRGLVHCVDRDGMMASYRFADGKRDHYFLPFGGDLFERTFVAKRGRRMVIAAFERQRPDMVVMPEHSAVEVVDLGDPPAVEREYLLSAKREAVVEYPAAGLKAAMNEETLALAMRNRIVFTDLRLGPGAAFSDSFFPFALALDEADRAYLLAGDRVPRALWLLTPRGERVYSFEFPSDMQVPRRPPVIGYDHRAYVLTRDRVLAVSPEGKLAWERPAGAPIGGAAITANDWLLVAAGPALAAFDAQGQRRELRAFPGEQLLTPPVLTSDGDLLVASAKRLYRLTPRR